YQHFDGAEKPGLVFPARSATDQWRVISECLESADAGLHGRFGKSGLCARQLQRQWELSYEHSGLLYDGALVRGHYLGLEHAALQQLAGHEVLRFPIFSFEQGLDGHVVPYGHRRRQRSQFSAAYWNGTGLRHRRRRAQFPAVYRGLERHQAALSWIDGV